jgi:hypothetical protein
MVSLRFLSWRPACGSPCNFVTLDKHDIHNPVHQILCSWIGLDVVRQANMAWMSQGMIGEPRAAY